MAPQTQLPEMTLTGLVDQLEALLAERRQVDAQISTTYKQAKGLGYNPAAMKALVARRSSDAAAIAEQDALVDMYARALEREAQQDAA